MEENTSSLLVAAAKAIGGAAGKVAALGKTVAPAPAAVPGASPVNGKFPKKNKSRLPRRLKKKQKREAMRLSALAGSKERA